jgi:phosphoketolase
MSATPQANNGLLLGDLLVPDFRAHAVNVTSPGGGDAQELSFSRSSSKILSGKIRAISGSDGGNSC